MTATNILPTVTILSREIDDSGEYVQFRFKIKLTKGKKRATFEYFGGKHAFLPEGYNKTGKSLEELIEVAVIDPMSVCAALVSDTQAGDESFEDFCGNFGYDTDSRKAEAIHKACKSNGRKFRQLVGEDFDAIAELVQDY